MPVRLRVGIDKGPHQGYGLTHNAASRDLDGLWEKTSPEKFLSNILSRASELWESTPGREILVRGKRPSSWIVLQLIKQDGFYSIVTAYNAQPGQKPKGKRLPLAERFLSGNGKQNPTC